MGGYLRACATGLLLAMAACASQTPDGAGGRARAGANGILWAFDTGGAIESSATLVGDTVVVASDSGVLHALDRKTGSVRWKYDTRQDGAATQIHTDPLAADNAIIVGSDGPSGGQIYAFEAGTGQVRWKAPVTGSPGGAMADFAEAGGNLYAVGMDGKLRSLDLRTGKESWSFNDVVPASGPAVDAGRVFVGGADGKVRALDAATGQPAWETDLESDITTSLIVHEGVVYVGTAPFRVVGLDAATGSVTSKIPLQAKPVRTLVPAGDKIVAFLHSNDGEGEADTVICLDRTDGRIVWARKAPSEWTSIHPQVWGDAVLAGDREGDLQAFGLADGVKRWTHKSDEGIRSIGVSADAFYLGTSQGTVFALDAQKASSTAQTTK